MLLQQTAISPRRRRASVMIEVALMIVIIGVGALAMMQFMTAATHTNRELASYPIGIAIARAGHEWARSQDLATKLLPYFAANASAPGGYDSYTPGTAAPILGIGSTTASPRSLITTGEAQKAYEGWTQRFNIRYVQVKQPTAAYTSGDKDAVELTVTAIKDGRAVCNLKRIYYLN